MVIHRTKGSETLAKAVNAQAKAVKMAKAVNAHAKAVKTYGKAVKSLSPAAVPRPSLQPFLRPSLRNARALEGGTTSRRQ